MTRGYLKNNNKGQLILKCGYCAKKFEILTKEHKQTLIDHHNLKYFGYVCSKCRPTADLIVFEELISKNKI